MSLATLVNATATARRPPEASPSAPWPPWWTIGLAVVRNGNPVSAAIDATTAAAYPSGTLMPVPTALPPSGSSPSDATSACERRSGPSHQARPGVGLLSDRHRGGVHEVGAAGLHDVDVRAARRSSAPASRSRAG